MNSASPFPQPLFDLVDELVDPRVGIIRHLGEVPRRAGTPDFFHFYAQACNTIAFCPQRNFGSTGGASTIRAVAMAKSIGEAVERYCAAFYEPKDLSLNPFESAPFRCVEPEKFALYSEEQFGSLNFPYKPFTPKTPVRWTKTINPASNESWCVPAGMVYIPYYFGGEEEPAIGQPISTGLACHSSYEEAAITAICEVIERDAFMITWQAQLSMPHILLDTLSENNRDLVMRFKRTGHSVTLLNLSFDHGIPVILAVLHSNLLDSPALVFAASSHPNPEIAVQKSLEELAHTRRLAEDLQSSLTPLDGSRDHADIIKSQANHVHFYCNHRNAAFANFIFNSTERIEFQKIRNISRNHPQTNLKILIEKMENVDHMILLADLTTPDVEDLGLKVVRAVIPGFHPLFMGHSLRALGGNRLWTIPQQLGFKGITPETGDNPYAHPYP